MSKEELIAEAKRRYPIGCRYKCAATGTLEELDEDSCAYSMHTRNQDPAGAIYGHSGGGLLYANGVWAEVLNEKTIYPIYI